MVIQVYLRSQEEIKKSRARDEAVSVMENLEKRRKIKLNFDAGKVFVHLYSQKSFRGYDLTSEDCKRMYAFTIPSEISSKYGQLSEPVNYLIEEVEQ